MSIYQDDYEASPSCQDPEETNSICVWLILRVSLSRLHEGQPSSELSGSVPYRGLQRTKKRILEDKSEGDVVSDAEESVCPCPFGTHRQI